MSTLKTTPTLQPAGQTQALFDPFWNGGAHWQGASAQHPARWNSIAGQEALTQFEAITLQFQSAATGWKALRLTPPHFDTSLWATPSQRDMLEGLLTEIAPPTRDGFIFVLPNASVVVLMYHPDANGLVPLVYKISAMHAGGGSQCCPHSG